MAVAGHIVANLTTNTAGWSSGLNAALGPLSEFASATMRIVGSAVMKFSEVGDSLAKMSDRTSISVEELSKLSYAAGLSDASMEGLQNGLLKMNQFLLTAKEGSATATKTLQTLGVSMDQLNTADASGKFGLFADALNAVEDPGERAALAMRVFGKGAAELLPLLEEGSHGIKVMGDNAERLGLVLSSAAAKAAADLNDAWGEMINSVDMLVVTFGGEFAPIVAGLASLFSQWLADNRELVIVFGKVAVVVAGLIGLFKTWKLGVEALTKAMIFAKAFSGPKQWIALAAGIAVAAGATWAMNEIMENAAVVGEDAIDIAKQRREAEEQAAAAVKNEAVPATQDFTAAMQQLKSSYDAILPKSVQVRAAVAKMASDWIAAKNAGAELTLTQQQLAFLMSKTILNESGFTGMLDSVRSELSVLHGDITETEQKFQAMAAFGVDTKALNVLRQMMAERDRLLSEQQQKEKAAEETRRRITGVTQRVLESQETPFSRFAAEARDVQEAIASGSVSVSSGLQYLEQLRKKMLEDQTAEATPAQRAQASNVGLDARSAQANQMIVDLVNRRAASPEQAALKEQQKATQLAVESKELLQDIRDDTRRRAIAARPWGQRT